jgi:hypothetical protein
MDTMSPALYKPLGVRSTAGGCRLQHCGSSAAVLLVLQLLLLWTSEQWQALLARSWQQLLFVGSS